MTCGNAEQESSPKVEVTKLPTKLFEKLTLLTGSFVCHLSSPSWASSALPTRQDPVNNKPRHLSTDKYQPGTYCSDKRFKRVFESRSGSLPHMSQELVPAKPKKMGRPSTKTPEREELALRAIREGKTQRQIDKLTDGTPDYSTILAWRDQDPDFSLRLARANSIKASRLIDQSFELIDSVDPDAKSGNARVSKAREQIGLRKYVAACLDRQTWGDKLQLDANVKVQAMVAFVDMAPPEPGQDAGGVIEAMPHVPVPDGAEEEQD